MANDFISESVAYGLKHGEFDHISERDKKKLIRLMARISEKSYRRGFQQGGILKCCIEPWEFRYKVSLDKSPFAEGDGGMSATERLYCECPVLSEIGFHEPQEKQPWYENKGRYALLSRSKREALARQGVTF